MFFYAIFLAVSLLFSCSSYGMDRQSKFAYNGEVHGCDNLSENNQTNGTHNKIDSAQKIFFWVLQRPDQAVLSIRNSALCAITGIIAARCTTGIINYFFVDKEQLQLLQQSRKINEELFFFAQRNEMKSLKKKMSHASTDDEKKKYKELYDLSCERYKQSLENKVGKKSSF